MIDIKQHIGQILYERNSLIIPDLGGFVSKYQPATIDHVQGLLHPPSKKLRFNTNLLINDGVLIGYLQEDLGLTVKEAKKSIEDFVQRTLEMLNNREIVLFPGVGRLYKDYENNLQFLQDNTNYNTQVYGLPTLQFYPILRSRPTSGSLQSDNQTPRPAAASGINYRKAANAFIPLAMIAIITIGALMFSNQNQTDGLDTVKTLPIAEHRINKKPGDELSIIEGLKNQWNPSPVPVPVPLEEEVDEFSDAEALTENLAPEMKECVIIIGAFGKRAGVERRVKDIIDLGYSVYQDKKGKLTRVGIQFAYQYDIEVREKLAAMRDNFDNRAWILNE